MKSERLNIRLTPEEQELLRRAAEASGQTISDYVLTRVLTDAHDDLADRGLFEVDAPRWKELGSRLRRAGEHRPEVSKLLDRPRPWGDGLVETDEENGAPSALEKSGTGRWVHDRLTGPGVTFKIVPSAGGLLIEVVPDETVAVTGSLPDEADTSLDVEAVEP